MKIFTILSVLIGVLVLLTVFAGWYMARFASLRKKDVPDYWTHPESLPPLYKHVPESERPAVLAGQKFLLENCGEPIYIRSRDGLRLQGHYFPPDEGETKGIYLQIHGYRSHPLCDFGGACLKMHEEGYGLLQIDHRAHGGSEGKYITFGLLERYDIVEWCRYLEKAHPGVPVMLDGISMGGATVMLAAGEDDLPDNVRGIIADCGYTSPADICKKVLKQWFGLPPFPIYYAAVLWLRVLTGVWFSYPGKREDGLYITGHTSLSLSKNKRPILIAHGTADTFVPYWMGEENYSYCDPAKAAFVSVEGAEHGIAWIIDRETYSGAIHQMWEKIREDV